MQCKSNNNATEASKQSNYQNNENTSTISSINPWLIKEKISKTEKKLNSWQNCIALWKLEGAMQLSLIPKKWKTIKPWNSSMIKPARAKCMKRLRDFQDWNLKKIPVKFKNGLTEIKKINWNNRKLHPNNLQE